MISKRELLERLGEYKSYDQICADLENLMIKAGGEGKRSIIFIWPTTAPYISEENKQKLYEELTLKEFSVSKYYGNQTANMLRDPLYLSNVAGILIKW